MSLSACVTRILSLSGFPSELKTRDIQAAFADFENERGGFKIKWIDDTSLLIVFNDPAVAKRAYLQTLLSPPPQFISPTSETTFILRPYDGPDAQNVIAAVNSRANGHRARPSISTSTSLTGGSGTGHARRQSSAGTGAWKKPTDQGQQQPAAAVGAPLAREPSPTLPSLPAQPTLGSLISSELRDANEVAV